MLNKEKFCPNCNEEYDPLNSECPYCKEENKDFESLKISKNIIVVPLWLQVTLFLVGLIGFQVIGFVLMEILLIKNGGGVESLESLTSQAIINFGGYIILFIVMAILLSDRMKNVIKGFKSSYTNYLMGFALGAILILLSLGYGILIEMLGFSNVNANQGTIFSIATNYPILSLFILSVIGPFCEELTYRVGLFGALRRANRILAYVVSILVFALLHFDFSSIITASLSDDSSGLILELVNLPAYILGGFMLTFTYEKYGIPGSFCAHFLNNFFSIALILISANMGI